MRAPATPEFDRAIPKGADLRSARRVASKVAEKPTSKAAIDWWAGWFDTKKTSIAEALKVFEIDTDLDSEDDDADEVPVVQFDLRAKQAECLRICENYFWRLKKTAARIICLKSRRYGMSTFFLLWGLERILRIPGYRVLLVAQDDVMARTHFQRLRAWLKQIPAWALAEQGITIVKDTDQQVVLRHGQWKESEFRVAPAKRNALGRGDRFNMLILTEFPAWPKAAKADLSGILRACKNRRGNVTVFESTARGHDEFYRRWTRAEKRRSDYRALFIASYEHPGNRAPLSNEAAETALLAKLGTETEFGGDEETILFRRLMVDLKWPQSEALSFLNWRRNCIIDDCEGLLDVYHREEPSTPSEAFAGTGFPIFRKDLLGAWEPLAEAREEKAKTGRVVVTGGKDEKVEFRPERRGELVVFDIPEKATKYCYGADVASGLRVLADGKSEADFSVVILKTLKTGDTVARFRGHVRPRDFAEVIFNVACWYNAARGYVERNNDGGTVIDRMEEMERGDVSGADVMLRQRRLVKSDPNNRAYRDEFGFRTSAGAKGSKVALIDRIADFLIEKGVPASDAECPFDPIFVSEAMRYERDDRGRMNASVGHDDVVVAEALCLEARARLLREESKDDADEPKWDESKDEATRAWGIILRHAAGVREQERTSVDQAVETDVVGLPGY